MTEYRFLEKRVRLKRGFRVVSNVLQYRTEETVLDSDDHPAKQWTKWKNVPVQVAYLSEYVHREGAK